MIYNLTYAGIPFLIDEAKVFRVPFPAHEIQKGTEHALTPKKHQPLGDLIDELDRIYKFQYLDDFHIPGSYQGKNLGGVARKSNQGTFPNPSIPIGTWFYPTSASRWSVFRGLASSSQVKAMLGVTGGVNSALFSMQCVPSFANDSSIYLVESQMYMLPPRPLAEHGGSYDGLYLITLVDFRYYFQGTPVSLHANKNTTWDDFIEQLEEALDISISYSPIPEEYSTPELDSNLWCNWENANTLLDAIAANIGCTFVRNLDGTHELYTPDESHVIALNNRGSYSQILRTAGGDLFSSGDNTKAGDLGVSRNAIVPDTLNVTFPKYVVGDDPVPHYLNPRQGPPGRTSWHEESYGATYQISVPIASGGLLVSGLIGRFEETIRCTAKALLSSEIQVSGVPLNAVGLTSLALQIAEDFYAQRVGGFLDETYPGSAAWQPEGLHDIIWKWSAKDRQVTTRIIRGAYNTTISEMQQDVGVSIPIGGKSVAQSVRDSCGFSGSPISSPTGGLASGAYVIELDDSSYFPTQNRWRGLIDDEVVLMEGTSGGTTVNVVYRGIDGTLEDAHDSDSVIQQIQPDITHQVNLVTYEKGQFTYPSEWTSGGIIGVNVVPQIQTVEVLAGSGEIIEGTPHFSGIVLSYDPTISGDTSVDEEYVWLTERNSGNIVSGMLYGGLLVGYSAGDTPSPIYLVGEGTQTKIKAHDIHTSGVIVPNTQQIGGLKRIYGYSSNPDASGTYSDLAYWEWRTVRGDEDSLITSGFFSGYSDAYIHHRWYVANNSGPLVHHMYWDAFISGNTIIGDQGPGEVAFLWASGITVLSVAQFGSVFGARIFGRRGNSQIALDSQYGRFGTIYPGAQAYGGIVASAGALITAVPDVTSGGDASTTLNALLASLRAGNILAP